MKKKLFIILFIFLLWGIGGFAQSSSSVTVTPITADYSANPPTVTFKVSWPEGSRDAVIHRSKVWVFVDYRRVLNNAHTGGWLRAGISSAHTPTTNSGAVSLVPGNTKGFWLQGSDGAFAATVTVPVTVDLNGYSKLFGWCGVASDRPPTAIEHDGYYALFGTPDFIVNGTITEPTNAYIGCIYSLTDSTGAPGEAPAMPAITGFTASTTTICKGGSVTLTATATNAASYSFNNGAWSSSSTTVVSPTSATTYTLKVRSAGGCTVPATKTITITVNENNPPTGLSLTADPLTVCPGEPATLTATPAGAAAYSLDGSNWTASEQLTDYPTETTTYTLYIKSADGCTASLENAATVTVHTAVEPATISGDASNICPASTVALTASATCATTFTWYKNGSQIKSGKSSTYSVTSSGSYTVEGKTANCTGPTSASKVVTIRECVQVPGCANLYLYQTTTPIDGELPWLEAVADCSIKGARLPSSAELQCMCLNWATLPGGAAYEWVYWSAERTHDVLASYGVSFWYHIPNCTVNVISNTKPSYYRCVL